MKAVLSLMCVIAVVALGVTAHQARQQAVARDTVLSSPDELAEPGSAQVPTMAPNAGTGTGAGTGAGMSGGARLAQPDPGWVVDAARDTAIPQPAMRAYARAALNAPKGCGLGWTTLAAVGWVESHHGGIDGRSLLDDGHSSTPIAGPPLDGVGPVARIPATAEGTAMHGDPIWERAVGPMQFLPSTWATWARDGDGDSTSDANDLDDAALAAAHYLCHAGGDLTSLSGWSAAVRAYNDSAQYVLDVNTAAIRYAAR